MKSRATRQFWKLLEKLPRAIQEQSERAYEPWRTDPHQSSLQFKRVSQRQPFFSVHVGIGYRALGLREKDQIYWFWIGGSFIYSLHDEARHFPSQNPTNPVGGSFIPNLHYKARHIPSPNPTNPSRAFLARPQRSCSYNSSRGEISGRVLAGLRQIWGSPDSG